MGCSIVSFVATAYTIIVVSWIYFVYYLMDDTGHMILPFAEEPCSSTSDNPTLIASPFHDHASTELDACQFFAETYQQAQQRFQAAVMELQESQPDVQLTSIPIVTSDSQSTNNKKNPQSAFDDSSSFTMDIAVLPGHLPGVVIHSSGTHGVEGYAGSAIQLAFLHAAVRPDQRPTVVLVHAINPFGMAHYRRVNENNVDLNRNGLTPDQFASILQHNESTTQRQNYDALSYFLRLDQAPSPYWSWLFLLAQGARALTLQGYAHIKRTLVTAQYHAPDGVFYAGTAPQRSLVRLVQWFRQQPPLAASGPATWIDVHTGLGPLGVDTLLVKADSLSETERTYLEETFPGALLPWSSHSGSAAADGYQAAQGFLPPYVEQQASLSTLHVTQEFGTISSILVAGALILENAAHAFLEPKAALEWSQKTLGRAFYPQSAVWRQQVLERGLTLLDQALARSRPEQGRSSDRATDVKSEL